MMFPFGVPVGESIVVFARELFCVPTYTRRKAFLIALGYAMGLHPGIAERDHAETSQVSVFWWLRELKFNSCLRLFHKG